MTWRKWKLKRLRNRGSRAEGRPGPEQPSASMRGLFRRDLNMADPVTELELRRRGMPLDDLIDIADDLGDYQWLANAQLPGFVFSETARATKTVRAAALLASKGYGPQALVLARTLTESMFFIRWAILKPDGVDARIHLHYRLAATIEGEAWLNSGIGKFDSRPDPPLSKEDREQAVGLFGKRCTRLWTSHSSIKDFVKELIEVETANDTSATTVTSLRAVFDLMLGWADRMTHTTGISTMSGFEASLDIPGGGYANTGPSLDQLTQAIMLTQTTYGLTLDALLPKIAPELEERLTAATSRAWRSYHDVERLTAMKPTDPCICDHPQGSWAECHMLTDQYADHDLETELLAAIRHLS